NKQKKFAQFAKKQYLCGGKGVLIDWGRRRLACGQFGTNWLDLHCIHTQGLHLILPDESDRPW
ncbi:MAG: hypothetical protein ACI3Z8_04085, partial [Paludibacteraceae bacterium]